MQTADKVSVIIPVYNRSEYILDCINSLFRQTHKNFEVIIVDDGSTDGTVEICKKLAEEDDRIKFFQSSHGGVSSARNYALEHTTGEYVFFLDSDDMINSLLLETLVREMKKHNASIGACNVFSVYNSNWEKLKEKLKIAPTPSESVYKNNSQALTEMFSGITPLSCIGGVMMKRELIGNTRFSKDLFIGEDFWFIYENVIKNADCVFLVKQWYYARLHENNSSNDYSFDGFMTRFERRRLVWESEERLGRFENVKKQKLDGYDCFIRCFEQNEPDSADVKKMRKILKEYKTDILPALSFKQGIAYRMYIYTPKLIKFILKRKSK